MRVSLASAIGAAFLLLALLLAIAPGPAHAGVQRCGSGSWYGTESGTRTATGERFTGNEMTAAMPQRSMLGKRVRVTYRGRSIVVRVNDIGPASRLHRVIDLSRAAAARIGLIGAGVGRVCIETLN